MVRVILCESLENCSVRYFYGADLKERKNKEIKRTKSKGLLMKFKTFRAASTSATISRDGYVSMIW